MKILMIALALGFLSSAFAASSLDPRGLCATDPECEDGNPCTTDVCLSGTCVHGSNDAPCEDGDPCTAGETCADGFCPLGFPRDCDDGDPCTMDSCALPIGCVHALGPHPDEVTMLLVGGPLRNRVTWTGDPAAGFYDLVRGTLSDLPVGPSGGQEVCFGNLPSTSRIDSQVPATGQGFWYDVRAVGCRVGPFGSTTIRRRATATCDTLGIATPLNGEIVNRGVVVMADTPTALASQIATLRFEYSPDGGIYVPITGVAPYQSPGFSALWQVTDLPPGPYFLRGVAQLAGVPGDILFPSVPVAVTVNAPPIGVASTTSCQTDFGAPTVSFTAAGSVDPDGFIQSYRWNFGDGTVAFGSEITHAFPFLDAYSVTLTVTDDRGGTNHSYVALDLQPGNQCIAANKTDCGCESMDIKNDGKVDGPKGYEYGESSGIAKDERGNLGAYNDGVAGALPVQLDMKKDPLVVKHRFEVIATLKPNSKPQLCAEGQYRQGTEEWDDEGNGTLESHYREGNRSSDPRYDSTKSKNDPYIGNPPDDPAVLEKSDCSYGGTDWCDDDYHGGGAAEGTGNGDKDPPHTAKKYEDQKRILWLDAPGFAELSPSILPPTGVKFSAKFKAIVSGNLGSCTCTWGVKIEVSAAGKVTKNELQDESCTHSLSSRDGRTTPGAVREIAFLASGGGEHPQLGEMRFAFALEGPMQVELELLAPDGRTVRRLFSGRAEPGVYERDWDRRDDAGAPVPAGRYRYRMRANDWQTEGEVEVLAGE